MVLIVNVRRENLGPDHSAVDSFPYTPTFVHCTVLYCHCGGFFGKKNNAWSLQNYVFIYTKILIEELEIVSLVLCVFVKPDTVPKDTSRAEQANADCWVSSLLEGRLDSVTAVQSLHYSSLEGM